MIGDPEEFIPELAEQLATAEGVKSDEDLARLAYVLVSDFFLSTVLTHKMTSKDTVFAVKMRRDDVAKEMGDR